VREWRSEKIGKWRKEMEGREKTLNRRGMLGKGREEGCGERTGEGEEGGDQGGDGWIE
jgi:hypothetical protein